MKNTFKPGDFVALKSAPAKKIKVEQVMGPELYRCIVYVDGTEQYIDYKGEDLMLYTKP